MYPNQSLSALIPLNILSSICGKFAAFSYIESRKTLEQNFIFLIGTLDSHDINVCLSFNW